MSSHLRNQELRVAESAHRSGSSRESSENGVSSRVEACRKRLRMVRGNQKGPSETVEPVGVLVAFKVEADSEVSQGLPVIETRVERIDEAGIT